MKLYLDDDIVAKLLVRLLIQHGHDVEEPVTAGLSGSDDPIHLTHAVQSGRVFLSANHDDFRLLQNLLMVAGGHHPGILVVRKDNDPRRDLSARGIVNCIAKLVAAQVPLADQFIILNHWR
jgi:hypothetical protein